MGNIGKLKINGFFISFILFLFLTFFLLISGSYASDPVNSGNNSNFLNIRFKTTFSKKKGGYNDGSARVVIVSSPKPAIPANKTFNRKTKYKKHKINNINSVTLAKIKPVKTSSEKIASNYSNLASSGLLVKKGDSGNYQKNLSRIFPMIINKEIIHYIHYYQTSGRRFFKYALSKSKRYIPMIKKIFKKIGLPNDLAYLAMVESGFSPTAYSYAGASGMWQFIPSTGRIFGLTVNWWVDERRNPVESTYAAGEYLKDLFNKFGSWYLAAAAYNSGELTIERALSVDPGGNFWTISQNRPYLLPGQTRRYVPKIIAAAIIAKDPANFGFHDIKYQKPLEFKQVNVPFPVNLYDLAKCIGIPEYKLQKMNPELLRNATPPNDPGFMLNIPASDYGKFLKNFKKIKQYIVKKPVIEYTTYSRPKNNVAYTVEPGDTLMGIAAKYGVSLGTIERYNGLDNYSVLKVGEKITIPGKSYIGTDTNNIGYGNAGLRYIIVKPGMTLWSISKNFNVPLSIIRNINHINGNDIHSGEKIFLKGGGADIRDSYINGGGPKKTALGFLYYRVKFGDSLYNISSKFHDNIKNIMADNNIKNPNAIYPGEILKIAR